MGLRWRNVLDQRVCIPSPHLRLRWFLCRRPIRVAPGYRNHLADFHPHLSKHRDDYLAPSHYRCAIAADQLLGFVRPHHHVRPGDREQRLDSPQRSCRALARPPRFTFTPLARNMRGAAMETDYKVRLE